LIHVCFALYDKTERYSKFTGTTMLSLFENTYSKVVVHLLHDNTLTPENRDKFIYLAGQYNQLVKFYNVDELCADEIGKVYEALPHVSTDRHTIAMFYRFFVTKLMPPNMDKIIYLDSDIIVNLDIAELWHIEPGDKVLGVIPELFNYKTIEAVSWHPTIADGLIKAEDYFNSGVLLINLNAFRNEEKNLWESAKFIGKNPKYMFLDQDILNHCFSTRTLKLPVKFNKFVSSAREENETQVEKEIYHFASRTLNFDTNDPFNLLWMEYFALTPWFEAKTIIQLYECFQLVHIDLKQLMIKVSTAMNGKTRVFFVESQSIDAVKKIFNSQGNEEFIPAEDKNAIANLVYAMGKFHDRKIFFIFSDNFDSLNDVLTQLDFVKDKDFFDGTEFLSEEHGLPLKSHPLIKFM